MTTRLSVCDALRRIEGLAALYEARFLRYLLVGYPERDNDPWQGLAFFLEGYAYERRGRSPEFGPVAGDALLSVQAEGFSFDSPGVAAVVWERYCQLLGGRSPNARLNPVCPRGMPYPSRAGGGTTTQPSALEFMQARGGLSIVAWARDQLRAGEVQQVHLALTTINGVGPKISSFLLRDVALLFGIEPDQHRELLQPVDVWVQRAVQRLSGDEKLSDRACARWIVDESRRVDLSPERINQGVWYLAAQIAGSLHGLSKCLTDPGELQRQCQEHVGSLAGAVSAFEQCSEQEGRSTET